MQNIQGLDYGRITDLGVLSHGDYLHQIHEDNTVSQLRVWEPYGYYNGDAWATCLRLGRHIRNRFTKLRAPDLATSTLLRAVIIPTSGIPGTWCDGLDDNGDPCGLDLLHQGNCRH